MKNILLKIIHVSTDRATYDGRQRHVRRLTSTSAISNLSESFETNATVDVSFSNAVTGTKQLKMLGLDQKYTALIKELLPEIRGLASAYGLSFIPGRWIGGIQLTKGGSGKEIRAYRLAANSHSRFGQI